MRQIFVDGLFHTDPHPGNVLPLARRRRIGVGTDVAIETADVVLMGSDPLDVPTALAIGRATLRKMRQNLGWAIGYNTVALPIAAGVFQPSLGLELRPEIAALSMSSSSFIVAVNALLLKRLRLPGQEEAGPAARRPHPPGRRFRARRSLARAGARIGASPAPARTRHGCRMPSERPAAPGAIGIAGDPAREGSRARMAGVRRRP